MPDYHNNILCVTPKEVAKAYGISCKTVYRYISGQENGELYCWENHKQGKNTYLHFHSLKPKYQEQIKIHCCDGLEPEVWIKKRDEQKAKASIENITDQITGLVTSDTEEIELLTQTKQYSPTEVHQLARAAGWLRLINDFNVTKARKLGFNSIVEFRQQVFKRCLNEQTQEPPLIRFKKGLITNERTLYKNAVDYRKEGIQCLIHKGVGNVNREKENKDPKVHAKLIQLHGNPVKYSWEDTAMMYNNWALENDKPEYTVSAVKQYLNTPKIKKVWYYLRHGKHAADNELQPLINREKPSFPDALWSLDGTTTQLYYKTVEMVENKKTGKVEEKVTVKSDLYGYFVVDANSTAIIGSAVAYAETSGLVTEALRDAITKHENKPYQLQYDNSSANVSVAVQNLMSNMSRVHFPCEPYKGRSKYVEGIIGHFQQRVLRYMDNFKGGNINVRSLNSQANPELLTFLRKNHHLLPDREQAINDYNKAINDWNTRGEKRDKYGRFVGQSKIERYTSIQHDKRNKLNYFDKLSMFMVEQRIPYSYGTQGIQIDIKGNKHHFIVPDGDGIGDFVFANENLGLKFKVKIDRDNPDMVALYTNEKKNKFVDFAYNKETYSSCVADAKEKKDSAKSIMFKKKQEQFGNEYAQKEMEKQMLSLGEIKATGTDGFGWYDLSKAANNAKESAQEDALNGMNDGLTDKQRKILNIGK